MLSIDGLISGLDTSGLIEQILSLQRRPVLLAQQQIAKTNQKQTAFMDLTAKLLGLQSTTSRLGNPETFRGVQGTSSAESVLAASAGAGVPPGVYSFRVAQLASPSQYTSGGFASASDTAVGAGTLSLEFGGFIDEQLELDELNGGSGVTRGSIRITDRSGSSATVDLSAAVTVQDVIDAIGDAAGIDVTARVAGSADANTGRALVLVDSSGGAGNLTVEEVGGLDVAADLGIAQSVASATLEGSVIRNIGGATRLSTLVDGHGVRTGSGTDFTIAGGGVTLAVDLADVTTVQGLLDAVNQHADNGGEITMAVNGAGDGFTITDTTGTGGITVTDGPLASAATDLGIVGTTTGTNLAGSRRIAGIDDLFLSTLNGGSGVAAGSISVQSRASSSGTIIDLSGAETLRDVLRAIDDAGAGVSATINRAGNGLLIRDTSGGSGDLIVAESGGGTTAADLGILGTVSDDELDGSDLAPQYIHENTLLSGLNGGRGVFAGKIRITATDGTVFTVNLSSRTTIGGVITNINGAASAAGIGATFTAALSGDGNGIALTDTSGAGTLRVDEVDGGTTARDLHLVGSADAATPGVIDGAFEEQVTIASGDSLEDVRDAIAALGMDVTATILDDGSANPFRLNIISGRAGRAGRLLVDTSGGTALTMGRTAEARDGILFYGETSGATESILLRSSTNTYSDVIDGLTVTALGTSSTPTRVTVTRDTEGLKEDVADLVEKLNDVLSTIDDLTAFDVETEQRGLLLGDGTVRTIERQLLNGAIRPLSGVDNPLSLLREVGIRVVNGRLSFDGSTFDAAMEDDPDAVRKLFTASRPLADRVRLADFDNGNGVDTTSSGADLKITLRDGTEVEVDLSDAVYAEDVVTAIEDAAGAAGVTLSASISSIDNGFVLVDGTSGSTDFRVSAMNGSGAAHDLGLDRGSDVSGGDTITGSAIDLTDDPGIGARLTDLIDELTDSDDGVLQRKDDGFDEIIADLEKRVERLEERIARREEILRRQFAQLEQIIATSQNTQARLSAQFGALGGSGGR